MENKVKMAENLRESILKMAENAARNIEIGKIPEAKLGDQFSIGLLDEKKLVLKEIKVELGKNSLLNLDSNSKLFDYQDIDPDKFGKNCAIWIKNINLPKEFSQEKYLTECCFVYKINGIKQFICQKIKNTQKGGNCVLLSEKLTKGIKSGCLNENGLGNEIKNKKTIGNINTEIIGNHKSYLKNGQKNNLTALIKAAEENSSHEKTTSDNFFSSKEGLIFDGWLLVTTLQTENQEKSFSFKEKNYKISPNNDKKNLLRYVNSTVEELSIRENPNGKIIEEFDNDKIFMRCQNLCSISQYKEFFEKNPSQNLDKSVEKLINDGALLAGGEKKSSYF